VNAARLLHPPTENELARLYHELAKVGATTVGELRPWTYEPGSLEQLVVLAGEMLRYDPRLLSVLVQWFPVHYRELNPLELRRELEGARYPQSLLVALEFARLASPDPELQYFADYVSMGFGRVSPAERFFLGTETPGSRRAARNLGRNLKPYARWGFIGQERPVVDPVTKRTVGAYDAATRRAILERLASRHSDFSIAEYLDAVDHSVTRQQALSDLKTTPGLERTGAGRGSRWRRRPA
jgi:hypothetical protein